MVTPTPFRINATNPLNPLVEVAGVDVTTQLRRASLDLQSDSLPVLYLEHAYPAGVVEAAGAVIQRVAAEPSLDDTAAGDPRDKLVALLDRVDPKQWEKDAMDLLGLAADSSEGAGVTTVPQAFLAVLKRYLRGD